MHHGSYCVLVEPERQMNHIARNACYNRQVPPPMAFSELQRLVEFRWKNWSRIFRKGQLNILVLYKKSLAVIDVIMVYYIGYSILERFYVVIIGLVTVGLRRKWISKKCWASAVVLEWAAQLFLTIHIRRFCLAVMSTILPTASNFV